MRFLNRLSTRVQLCLAMAWILLAVAAMLPLEVVPPDVRERVASTLIVPVLVVAFHTGVKGGLLASLAASLVWGSLVVGQGAGIDSPLAQRVFINIVMINSLALATSWLSEMRRRANERYQLLFEQVPMGVYMTTPEGEILAANNAMARMFGYESDQDLKHINALELYTDPGDRARWTEALQREGELKDFEIQARRKDGSYIWVRDNCRVLPHPSGVGECYSGTMEDITRRKEAERELTLLNQNLERMVHERTRDLAEKAKDLEAANQRLQELDELKSAFVSTVSHDIRTPLTSVIGFAKMVRRDFERHLLPPLREDPERAARAERVQSNLEIVESEGMRVVRLINDFLDLSKIEAGHMEWKPKPLDMAECINEAAKSLSGEFALKPGVELRLELAEDLPVLDLDHDRMVQVLMNLLSNALKFTQQGSVAVSAARSDNGGLEVCVADTGVGIPLEEQERIFDKFHQVDRSDTIETRSSRGTGLGLAISRQIVEYCGGRLEVWSRVGQGSTFSFRLPPAA